jgi:hypothetical protein
VVDGSESRAPLTYGEDRPGQVHRHIASTSGRPACSAGARLRSRRAGRTIRWYGEPGVVARLVWMKSVTITGPGGQKLTY